MNFDSCLDELEKLGEVSVEEAHRALSRLEAFDQNRPTSDQVVRYGTLGAVSGPLIGAAGDLVAGRKPFGAAKRMFSPGMLRHVGGDAVKGALTAGAIPLMRSSLDRGAEEAKLVEFLSQHQAPPAPEPKLAGVGPGASMSVSQYSGPLSYGPFNLVSGLPNKAPPGLQGVVEKAADFGPATGFSQSSYSGPIEGPKPHRLVSHLPSPSAPGLRGVVKTGALLAPTPGGTPAQRLEKSRAVGTAAHNAVSGGSLKALSTPSPMFKSPGMPKIPGMPGIKASMNAPVGLGKATESLSRAFSGGMGLGAK